MRRTALRWALALLVLTGASGCAVRTVDCWQLDDEELAAARKEGRCEDAFARNSQEIVPLDKVNRPHPRKSAPPPAAAPPEPPKAKNRKAPDSRS